MTGNKSAAVMHPDGTRRLLYYVESPEAWFEDFGEAKCAGGRADVKLDGDFAALILTDTYHVFLTGHDEQSDALVVTRRPEGFIVKERKGGTSSGTFSYRLVAKRKDNPGKRLEKFAPPMIRLPKPEEMPAPPRKP